MSADGVRIPNLTVWPDEHDTPMFDQVGNEFKPMETPHESHSSY
jgi:hypothetical protein